MKALRPGTSGKNVLCLQQALVKNNYLEKVTGTYDVATQVAVTALQTKKDLFVDGIAGRETALALGIWPDENLLVVRTPPPAQGAKDSLGFLLSSVASTGASAPALPANSGSGRRLVFERAGQRVWAVDKNNEIIRSWLVSGSKYNNETPGTHQVYSRSEITTAWNGRAFLKKMVRWLKTAIGAIGFHQIPVHRSDNTVYQTEAELGTRLSGGCQRQAKLDADFLWSFAKIGTPVVVL
jgi:lipoprotein-anchoring transpeptidase ErfK/SrfK